MATEILNVAPSVTKEVNKVLEEAVRSIIEKGLDPVPGGIKAIGRTVIRNGSCVTVNTFYPGNFDHLNGGIPHNGLTGQETEVSKVHILPVRTFVAVDNNNGHRSADEIK